MPSHTPVFSSVLLEYLEVVSENSRKMFRPLVLTLAISAAWSFGPPRKPDFSGIWKASSSSRSQIFILDQKETELRFYEIVNERLSMLRAPFDGQSQVQQTSGSACELLTRWKGNALFLETKRPGHGSVAPAQVQYLLHLSADGATISVTRTGIAPAQKAVSERWERQDPPHLENSLTGFDERLELESPKPHGAEEDGRLRGWLGYAFNDVVQAERGCLPIINRKGPWQLREDARLSLVYTYERNGLFGKAAQVCLKGDRDFYRKLASYPEISVDHRDYAQLQAAHDPDGRLLLPVTVAGKSASYMVDTGSSDSIIRMSEARRLGLRIEPLARNNTDGVTQWTTNLTIAPDMAIGKTVMRNVHFWVAPDDRLNWPGFAGVIGIDLLLKIETLRWDSSGIAEIGFPAQEKDIRKANLCFWDRSLYLEASSSALGRMVFYFDTGNNATLLYPHFAMANLDLIVAKGEVTHGEWTAHGGHRDIAELDLPEIPLMVGGANTSISPAAVILESVGFNRHGTIGMNLLNRAPRVTLDLHAMRLTLE
jgi:hypothetical protein